MLHSADELIDFLSEIARARLGDGYTTVDRARDFIEVFSTDAGKRVFSQIAQFCEPDGNPAHADKPGTLAFKEGQRWVMAQIERALVVTTRVPEIEEKPK